MSTKRNKLFAAFTSPVGKKLLTGITGLALTIFVIMHMIGNLSYFGGEGAYNVYSDFLLSTGPLLYTVEIILLVAVLIHIVLGISVWIGKRRARPEGYRKYRSVGKPSLQTFSSRTMIWTGLVLLVFLVVHLNTFKFGPGIEEGYIADANGLSVVEGTQIGPDDVEEIGGEVYIRDLRRLVTEKFQSPWYAFGYTVVMILLAFHLRHGVWSAFQSLGAMSPRLTPVIYTLGTILAILIAVGFFVLPLYIYFTH